MQHLMQVNYLNICLWGLAICLMFGFINAKHADGNYLSRCYQLEQINSDSLTLPPTHSNTYHSKIVSHYSQNRKPLFKV